MRRMLILKKCFLTRGISLLLSVALSVSAVPESAAVLASGAEMTPTDAADDLLQLQSITTAPGTDTGETVTLDGMMPANAAVSVQSSDICSEGSLCAYDITITDSKGEEFQPESDTPIQVSIRNPEVCEAAAQQKRLRVWHIHDDGVREEIQNYQIKDGGVVFETDGFSVFEVDNGDPPLRTYTFEMPENPSNNSSYKYYYFPTSGGKMICQQTVKNNEKPVFPQLPADITSRFTFIGWFVWTGSAFADTPYDFRNVEEVTQNETITLRAVFKSCVYAIFHDQYSSRSQKFPIMATRRGDLAAVSATDIYGVHSDWLNHTERLISKQALAIYPTH